MLLATQRREALIAGPDAPAQEAAPPADVEQPRPEASAVRERLDLARAEREQPASSAGSGPGFDPGETRDEWVVTIVGRVVNRSGAPIEGATLETPDGVVRARSNAEGHLVAQPEARAPWCEREGTGLWVFASGHAWHSFWLPVHDGATLHLGTLVLAPGADIRGVVSDASGAPVADVELVLGTPADWPADEQQARRHGVALRDKSMTWAVTDAQGRYRLRGAPAGKLFVIAHAEDHGYSWSEPFLLRAGEDTTRDLVLAGDGIARAQWAIRVLDPHGAPVQGARIGIHQVRADPPSQWIGLDPGVTDERGLLWCTVQVGDTLRLTAFDPDERWQPSPEQRLLAQEDAAFDLVLREPAYRTVVVADELGQRIPWSNVRLSSDRWPIGPAAGVRPTGADGSLRIPLADEPFSIRAFAPGFADAAFGPFDPASLTSEEPLVLRLAPGRSVGGRVLASGEPLAGAAVRLSWKSTPDARWLSSDKDSGGMPFLLTAQPHGGQATTDAAGSFVISVQQDGWYTANVEASGFPAQSFGPFEVRAAGSVGNDLSLARGGAIEGRLVLAPGESAAGRLVGASSGSGLVFHAPVDEHGRYRIEDLAPGPYQVRGRRAPAARRQALRALEATSNGELVSDCVVREGATTRFDLDLSAEGSVVLEGSFQGPPGAACWVQLERADDGRSYARADLDASGRFRLAVSRADRYWIEVMTEDGLFRQPLALVPGTQEWSAAPRWGTIAVRHQPQGGGPLDEGALVLAWRGPAGSSYEAVQWNNRMSRAPTPPIPFPAGLVEVLREEQGQRTTLREPFTLLAGESVVLDLMR